jgi:hypothetical protein
MLERLRNFFSVHGCLEFPAGDSQTSGRLLTALMQMLADKKAEKIILDKNKIHFFGGMFRVVGNWNVLIPIGAGRVWITETDVALYVCYRLSFLPLFLVAIGLPILAMVCRVNSLSFWPMVLMWLCLSTLSLLLTIFEFRSLLIRVTTKELGISQNHRRGGKKVADDAY